MEYYISLKGKAGRKITRNKICKLSVSVIILEN